MARPSVHPTGDEQQRVWSYIEGIAGRQALLTEGSRNDAENSGAYKAFRLALGVGISLDEVEAIIFHANKLNGQVADDGERQVRQTVASARSSAERDGPEYLEPRAPKVPAAYSIEAPTAADNDGGDERDDVPLFADCLR